MLLFAKVWANGLVILAAAMVSLWLVVGVLLGVPINGSTTLFAAGTSLYFFAVVSLGCCSQTASPRSRACPTLQNAEQALPSTHYTAFAQAVPHRGAGPEAAWPSLAAMAGLGAAFFGLALVRFRAALAAAAKAARLG